MEFSKKTRALREGNHTKVIPMEPNSAVLILFPGGAQGFSSMLLILIKTWLIKS